MTLEQLETRQLLAADMFASGDLQGNSSDLSVGVASLSASAGSQATNSERVGGVLSIGVQGSNGDDTGRDIAVDSDGNSYVVGTITNNNDEALVAKVASDGELQWTYEVASEGRQRASAVAVDHAGSVYVAGVFEGTVDFDASGDSVSRTSAGSFDIFLLKLNSSGEFVSVHTFGQSGGRWDYASDVEVDTAGNVVLTGYFSGTVDFDPSATGSVQLSSSGTNDMFLLKLDADGGFAWARAFGGPSAANGSANYESSDTVAIDDAGNVYVGGYFIGPGDFDREASYADGRDILLTRGVRDAFLAKYDADGSFLWARSMGAIGTDGGSYEKVEDIAFDAAGNPYVIGLFQGDDFDPGDGSTVSANGWFDAFISKFDVDGNLAWSKQIGGTGPDRGQAIAVADSGDVYAAGFFNGTVNFGSTTAGTSTLTSRNTGSAQDGSGDGFLLRLDSEGNFVSVRQYGGTGRDSINAIALDSPADVLLAGAFEETAKFDVGPGEVEATSSGGQDLFAARVIEPLTGGEIHGVKWNDVDGDGVRDPEDAPLANWTIYIDTNNNGLLDVGEPSTITATDDPATPEDETGRYSFTGLPSGTYTLGEVLQVGWEQTFPARGTSGALSDELMGFGVNGVAIHSSSIGAGGHDVGGEIAFDTVDASGFEPFVTDGSQWPQPGGTGSPATITYSYSNLLDGALPGGLTASELRSATEEALDLWASFAPLDFVEVPDSGPAPGDTSYPPSGHPDIRIGHHFIDGGSGSNVLAHAYYPRQNGSGLAGDIHFDSANSWSIGPQASSIDIVEVLVHELGHALGLRHEDDVDAILNPFYGRRYGGFGTAFLLPDDIAGIQAIYGERQLAEPGTWTVTIAEGDVARGVDFGNHTDVAGLPDLIVSDLRVIDHPTNDIAYEYTVQNIGVVPTDASNVVVQAFVSADTVFNNAGDIPAGSRILGSAVGSLEPGESVTGSFGASSTFDPLTHPYLTLQVDSLDRVAESDESNNTAATLIEPVSSDELLGIRVEATDLNGNLVSTVNIGDEFEIRVLASDLRADPQGVFAAYTDVVYNSAVTLAGPVIYGDSFPNVQQGDASSVGLLDEFGATAGFGPLGGGEFVLFRIPFTATSLGTAEFETNAADLLPQHESLLFGSGSPVAINRIAFGSSTLQILPGSISAATDEDHAISLAAVPNSGFTIEAFDATSASGAAVSDNGDGTLQYDPRGANALQALGANSVPVTDTITYRLRDPQGATTVQTATVTVTGVNDAPVVTQNLPDVAIVPTLESRIGLDGVFDDIEGDALSYEVTSPDGTPLPSWLRFDAASKTLVATPGLQQVGQRTSVQVRVTDSGDPAQSTSLQFEAFVDNPYHNEIDPLDVNHDGFVSALDALIIINDLNASDPRDLPVPSPINSPAGDLDVTNDLFVTPLDALLIVNELNGANVEGEGEGSGESVEAPLTQVIMPAMMLDSHRQERPASHSTAAAIGTADAHEAFFSAYERPAEENTLERSALSLPVREALEDVLSEIAKDVEATLL